tara:strand:+ start:476 stop:643 length:168 start_codon:yes stop_codon:yes gene_type:complete
MVERVITLPPTVAEVVVEVVEHPEAPVVQVDLIEIEVVILVMEEYLSMIVQELPS